MLDQRPQLACDTCGVTVDSIDQGGESATEPCLGQRRQPNACLTRVYRSFAGIPEPHIEPQGVTG